MSDCEGTGGFADIRKGAVVTVRDGADVVIALGSLGQGRSQQGGGGDCTFDLSPMTVPDADFYSVEVSKRGPVRFSRADLEARGWSVALTLG